MIVNNTCPCNRCLPIDQQLPHLHISYPGHDADVRDSTVGVRSDGGGAGGARAALGGGLRGYRGVPLAPRGGHGEEGAGGGGRGGLGRRRPPGRRLVAAAVAAAVETVQRGQYMLYKCFSLACVFLFSLKLKLFVFVFIGKALYSSNIMNGQYTCYGYKIMIEIFYIEREREKTLQYNYILVIYNKHSCKGNNIMYS